MCRLNPVQRTFDPDVHENQIRLCLHRNRDGLVAPRGVAGNFMTNTSQFRLDISGNDAVILYDEDSSRCHRTSSQ